MTLCVLCICVCAQSVSSAGGRFRLELWFSTGNNEECAEVANKLAEALSLAVPGLSPKFQPLTSERPSSKADVLTLDYNKREIVAAATGLKPVEHTLAVARETIRSLNDAVYTVGPHPPHPLCVNPCVWVCA